MPPEGRERAPALGPIVLWSTGVIARSAPGEAAGLVLLRLLAGVGPGAGVFVLMHLFDAVAALRGAAAGEALLRWTALYAAVRIALSDVPTRLGAPLEEALRQRVGYAVEAERLRRAAHLPLAALEAAETMERLERSGWPGDKIAGVFEHLVSGVLRAVVGIVGIALVFGRVYPWLPAVLVAAALAQGLWEVRAGRGWDALMFDETPERRRADYFADLLTDASAQAELRVFGLYGWLRARWSALYRALGRRRGAMRWRQVLATLPGVGFTAAVALAVLALLAWRLARHALAPGAFVALVGGVTSFDASASLLAMGLSQLARAATKAAWVREVLAGPAPGPAPKGGGRPGAPFPTPLRVGLTCEGVRFRYRGATAPSWTSSTWCCGRGNAWPWWATTAAVRARS
jgi:ABC-type multidrug transport system fused ATPase/permease subunit